MTPEQEQDFAKQMARSIRAVKFSDEPTPKYLELWWDFKHWCWVKWPFNSTLTVTSLQDYLDTPYSKKTIWYIFYRDHHTQLDGQDFLTSMGSKKTKAEDELIDTHKKFRWPVQYFLRETLGLKFFRFRLKDFWYNQVSARLRPRQKWLTDQIPKTWADKVWLIPNVNFYMVIDFVEGEKCFDQTDYDASGEEGVRFAKELKECYKYVKTERASLEELLSESYPDRDTMTGDYSVDYKEVNRLEKLITETDTKWLVWIVTNRDFFWT
jgi:hypothetical protein